MCYLKSEGGRCANCTRKQISQLENGGILRAQKQVDKYNDQLERAQDAKDQRRINIATNHLHEAQSLLDSRTERLRHLQRDYDATLTGRRSLEAVINDTESTDSQRFEAENRLKKAEMLNALFSVHSVKSQLPAMSNRKKQLFLA